MSPARIQLSRARGWRIPPGTIIVSRPSIWSNPWQPGDPGMFHWPNDHQRGSSCSMFMANEVTVREAVMFFARWLETGEHPLPHGLTREGISACRISLVRRRVEIRGRLNALRGRDLACWCELGGPCHADALLTVANRPLEAVR